MDTFQSALHNRLKKKKLQGQALGAHVLHVLRTCAAYPDEVAVRIQHQTIYVSLGPKEDAPSWYMRKQEILEKIHAHIHMHSAGVQFTELRISAT